MRASIRSVRRGASSSSPLQRHTPYGRVSSSVADAAMTSSRSRSGLPADRRHSRSDEAVSTGPPSISTSSARVSVAESGDSSSWSTRSSVHSARTGSGTCSPVRSVPSTVACASRAAR
jgi:hypothetical protein